MAKKLLILFCILLFNIKGYSQQYFFRKFSVEEGLPQSSVYCILQDSRGYIWMGTDAGVARFDGQKFTSYNKTNGLSDNVVRSLLEDSKGNIWIGTDNGITYYDGLSFKVIGKGEGLTGTAVLKIIEGSTGLIWAASNDGGLASISNGDSLVVKNFTNEEGLVSDFIFDIYEDQDKKLWLGMVGGLNILSFEDDSFNKIRNIQSPDFGTEEIVNILSLEKGSDGKIWIGTYGHGLYSATLSPDKKSYMIDQAEVSKTISDLMVWDIMQAGNGELWIATDKNGVIRLINGKRTGSFNKETGLLSNQILDLMKDKEGNVWFASFGQGALMYDDEKFLSYTEENGIPGTQVLDVLFTSDDIFYVATEEGLSKFRKEGTTIKRLSYITSSEGLNDVGANAIETFGPDQQIWVGTNKGINIIKGSKITGFTGNWNLENLKISSLLADRQGNMWLGTAGGYGKIFGDKLFFMSQENGLINDEVQTIIEDKKGRIWIGTMGGLVKLEDKTYTDFNEVDGLTSLRIFSLSEDPTGNIWIGTSDGGIFKFDITKDSLPIAPEANKGILSSNKINSLQFICDTLLVAGNDKGFDMLVTDSNQHIKKVFHYSISDGFLGGENNSNSISLDNNGLVWFGTKKGLIRFDPRTDFSYNSLPEPIITGVKLFFEDVDWKSRGFSMLPWTDLPANLILAHNDNHLTFSFTGFSYHNPDDLEFSYYLENQSKEWSPYSRNREILFSGVNPGEYTLKVRAKNKFGIIGNEATYSFVVKPPFWLTPWFLIASSLVFIFIIITIIRLRERSLRNEKIKLEKIVDERTREVVEQKDEIARQRDVVTYQKKEITDSIHYAERIQNAVLPDDNILNGLFEDYFILFKPKDIVSGDFYWMSHKNDSIVFTAADCTGHGVPGAFMSMLGVSFLNKIVNEAGIVQPSEILHLLRANIISALKQEGSYETTKDGMDIALCSVDLKRKKLLFSGANNPLFLIRKTVTGLEVLEKRGDKMPVGFHSHMEKFTTHEMDLQKGDTIYLFSDGFLDQFGGPEGRKFMKPRFRQMLLDNQALNMSDQKEIYTKILDEWMNYSSGHEEPFGQIDDIILLGVRI